MTCLVFVYNYYIDRGEVERDRLARQGRVTPAHWRRRPAVAVAAAPARRWAACGVDQHRRAAAAARAAATAETT